MSPSSPRTNPPQHSRENASDSAAVAALLGPASRRRWWQSLWLWGGLVLLAAGGAGGYFYLKAQARNAAPVYLTHELGRGDITLTVQANGTLQPTRSVNIGSELSGTVAEVLVDVNDRVRAGQVLVVLDTARLRDQVANARAGVASTRAQVASAEASLAEARSALARLEEVFRLSGGKVPSAAELDTAKAAVERARAAETSARAAVAQAEATLASNETSLSKASIRSPINGVVLTRTVDPGNAVAASLQAVTLFTIAEDLTRLRLDVAVDEADVGVIEAGQRATFTVSAYPARNYPAAIRRVDFGSTKTDNVVTYTTILDVQNDDLSLRPGMTASASIVATERKDVWVVPNTALRFRPPAQQDAAAPTVLGRMFGSRPRPPRSATPTAGNLTRTLYVLEAGQPVPLQVTAGISDGRRTEISGEGLREGLPIITELRSGAAGR